MVSGFGREETQELQEPTTTTAGNNERLVCHEHKCRSATAASADLIGQPFLANNNQQHLACLEADSAIDDAAQTSGLCSITQRMGHFRKDSVVHAT